MIVGERVCGMFLEEFVMKTNRFSVILSDVILIGRRVTDRLLAWLGANHRRTAQPYGISAITTPGGRDLSVIIDSLPRPTVSKRLPIA
jgi:hypothetical protein